MHETHPAHRARTWLFVGTRGGWAFAAAALICIGASAQEAALIGASLPLTGKDASYGRELLDGARACLAASAAKNVQLEALDDGGDAGRAAQNLRGLASNSRMLAVLGTFGTESTQAAMPVLEEARLAMVGPSTGSESLRSGGQRYMFHLRAGHMDEAAAIVTQLAELGIAEAAVIHTSDALGQEGLEGTRVEMARLTLRPSVVLALDASGTLAPAALKQLVAAAPPAVILIAHQAQAVPFIVQLRSTSLRPTITAVSEAGGELLFEKVGPSARGIGLAQVMPHPWSANLPVTRFYQAAMKALGQDKLGYYSFEGCMQMRVALESLGRTARPVTRDKLVSALESDFDFGGMRFQFAPRKRVGGRFVEMTVINQSGRVAR
ncbi:MAG TPA: ABC transporter substrate-binding protein [Ramlibacter sp.]|nr:ABC transporter substrate-binding protein [Ramlibacter sp.]